MKRLLFFGGVAVTAFGLGAWYWHRRVMAAPLNGYTLDLPPLLLKAERQIVKAAAGSKLDSYKSAEDFSAFLPAPTTNAEAYAKAAYWLAVASRLLQNRSLAAQAQALQVRGNATYSLPGSSWLDGSVGSIMADATQTLAKVAGTNRNALAVLAILRTQGSPGMIASARQTEADKGVIANTVEATAADIAKAATTAKGIVTGEGVSFWTKWGWRLGIGAVALLGLGIVFRPYVTAASTAVKGLLGTPSEKHPPLLTQKEST